MVARASDRCRAASDRCRAASEQKAKNTNQESKTGIALAHDWNSKVVVISNPSDRAATMAQATER